MKDAKIIDNPQWLSEVHDLREQFSDGAEECMEILRKLQSEIPEDASESEIEECCKRKFRLVLEKMGEIFFEIILYQKAMGLILDESDNQGLNIYFWPGYDSVLGEEDFRRVTLTTGIDNMPCGVGYSQLSVASDVSLHYELANTCIWYNRVLTNDGRSAQTPATDFIPGLTHTWISSGSKKLVNKSGSHKLRSLEIIVGDKYDFESNFGVARISLIKGSSKNWGKWIAKYLNDQNKIVSESRSETVSESGRWPLPVLADSSLSATQQNTIQEIRETLYSIWLGASFDEDWGNKNQDWLSEFIARLKVDYPRKVQSAVDFSWLVHSLEEERRKQSEMKRSDFRYWYTLPLEWYAVPTDLSSKIFTDSLGSAMLLSSHELPTTLLYLTSAWVSRIYQSMRDFEVRTKLNRASKQAGESEMQRLMAHEIKQVGHALTKNFIIMPPSSLKGRVQYITSNLPKEGWGIAPFPNFFEAAGKTIKLWCGYEDPEDFFDEPPQTMRDLLYSCWKAARDNMKPYACKVLDCNIPEDMDLAERTLLEIDRLWSDETLDICFSENAPPTPNWGDKTRGRWMMLTRFFVSSFINFIRHGSVNHIHQVTVDSFDKELRITFIDTNRYKTDLKSKRLKKDVFELINGARKITEISQTDTMTGKDVQNKIASALGGYVERSSLSRGAGKKFEIKLKCSI